MAAMKKLSKAEKRIRKLKKLAGHRTDRSRVFAQVRKQIRDEHDGLRAFRWN